MITAGKLITENHSTLRFQQWWRKGMNYPVGNIFRFRLSPRSCNARVGAPRLPPQRLSAFGWTDMSIRATRKIRLRFLPESRGREMHLIPLSMRSARFRLSGKSQKETNGLRECLLTFFGKMACRFFRYFGWATPISRSMDLHLVRNQR